jgi:hypothetical protein
MLALGQDKNSICFPGLCVAMALKVTLEEALAREAE